ANPATHTPANTLRLPVQTPAERSRLWAHRGSTFRQTAGAIGCTIPRPRPDKKQVLQIGPTSVVGLLLRRFQQALCLRTRKYYAPLHRQLQPPGKRLGSVQLSPAVAFLQRRHEK